MSTTTRFRYTALYVVSAWRISGTPWVRSVVIVVETVVVIVDHHSRVLVVAESKGSFLEWYQRIFVVIYATETMPTRGAVWATTTTRSVQGSQDGCASFQKMRLLDRGTGGSFTKTTLFGNTKIKIIISDNHPDDPPPDDDNFSKKFSYFSY